jgi:hypothetical protein
MGKQHLCSFLMAAAFFLVAVPPTEAPVRCAMAKNNEVLRVLKAGDIRKGEFLLIYFGALGECQKCTQSASTTAECVASKTHFIVKYIAVVRCSRELEISEYKREFGWPYPAIRELDSTRALLQVPSNARYALFDSAGNQLGIINENEFLTQDCERLAARLR